MESTEGPHTLPAPPPHNLPHNRHLTHNGAFVTTDPAAVTQPHPKSLVYIRGTLAVVCSVGLDKCPVGIDFPAFLTCGRHPPTESPRAETMCGRALQAYVGKEGAKELGGATPRPQGICTSGWFPDYSGLPPAL